MDSIRELYQPKEWLHDVKDKKVRWSGYQERLDELAEQILNYPEFAEWHDSYLRASDYIEKRIKSNSKNHSYNTSFSDLRDHALLTISMDFGKVSRKKLRFHEDGAALYRSVKYFGGGRSKSRENLEQYHHYKRELAGIIQRPTIDILRKDIKSYFASDPISEESLERMVGYILATEKNNRVGQSKVFKTVDDFTRYADYMNIRRCNDDNAFYLQLSRFCTAKIKSDSTGSLLSKDEIIKKKNKLLNKFWGDIKRKPINRRPYGSRLKSRKPKQPVTSSISTPTKSPAQPSRTRTGSQISAPKKPTLPSQSTELIKAPGAKPFIPRKPKALSFKKPAHFAGTAEGYRLKRNGDLNGRKKKRKNKKGKHRPKETPKTGKNIDTYCENLSYEKFNVNFFKGRAFEQLCGLALAKNYPSSKIIPEYALKLTHVKKDKKTLVLAHRVDYYVGPEHDSDNGWKKNGVNCFYEIKWGRHKKNIIDSITKHISSIKKDRNLDDNYVYNVVVFEHDPVIINEILKELDKNPWTKGVLKEDNFIPVEQIIKENNQTKIVQGLSVISNQMSKNLDEAKTFLQALYLTEESLGSQCSPDYHNVDKIKKALLKYNYNAKQEATSLAEKTRLIMDEVFADKNPDEKKLIAATLKKYYRTLNDKNKEFLFRLYNSLNNMYDTVIDHEGEKRWEKIEEEMAKLLECIETDNRLKIDLKNIDGYMGHSLAQLRAWMKINPPHNPLLTHYWHLGEMRWGYVTLKEHKAEDDEVEEDDVVENKEAQEEDKFEFTSPDPIKELLINDMGCRSFSRNQIEKMFGSDAARYADILYGKLPKYKGNISDFIEDIKHYNQKFAQIVFTKADNLKEAWDLLNHFYELTLKKLNKRIGKNIFARWGQPVIDRNYDNILLHIEELSILKHNIDLDDVRKDNFAKGDHDFLITNFYGFHYEHFAKNYIDLFCSTKDRAEGKKIIERINLVSSNFIKALGTYKNNLEERLLIIEKMHELLGSKKVPKMLDKIDWQSQDRPRGEVEILIDNQIRKSQETLIAVVKDHYSRFPLPASLEESLVTDEQYSTSQNLVQANDFLKDSFLDKCDLIVNSLLNKHRPQSINQTFPDQNINFSYKKFKNIFEKAVENGNIKFGREGVLYDAVTKIIRYKIEQKLFPNRSNLTSKLLWKWKNATDTECISNMPEYSNITKEDQIEIYDSVEEDMEEPVIESAIESTDKDHLTTKQIMNRGELLQLFDQGELGIKIDEITDFMANELATYITTDWSESKLEENMASVDGKNAELFFHMLLQTGNKKNAILASKLIKGVIKKKLEEKIEMKYIELFPNKPQKNIRKAYKKIRNTLLGRVDYSFDTNGYAKAIRESYQAQLSEIRKIFESSINNTVPNERVYQRYIREANDYVEHFSNTTVDLYELLKYMLKHNRPVPDKPYHELANKLGESVDELTVVTLDKIEPGDRIEWKEYLAKTIKQRSYAKILAKNRGEILSPLTKSIEKLMEESLLYLEMPRPTDDECAQLGIKIQNMNIGDEGIRKNITWHARFIINTVKQMMSCKYGYLQNKESAWTELEPELINRLFYTYNLSAETRPTDVKIFGTVVKSVFKDEVYQLMLEQIKNNARYDFNIFNQKKKEIFDQIDEALAKYQ